MLSACFLRWTKFDSVAKGFTRSLPFDILLVFYKDNAFFDAGDAVSADSVGEQFEKSRNPTPQFVFISSQKSKFKNQK